MAIVIRKFDFDMEGEDANNYARNKTITRVLNSFSLLLPAGERYFIESVRAYRDDVDQEFQERINLFIRQEGQHGAQHRKLNKMLEGVDLKVCDTEALEILQKYGKDKEHALLVTATLERYTGLMGLVLPVIEKVIFPKNSEIAEMWKLHALEEREHFDVSEDLLREKCNFGILKQAHFMGIAACELAKVVAKNYKRLKNAETGKHI